jgi:hypothetical protein
LSFDFLVFKHLLENQDDGRPQPSAATPRTRRSRSRYVLELAGVDLAGDPALDLLLRMRRDLARLDLAAQLALTEAAELEDVEDVYDLGETVSEELDVRQQLEQIVPAPTRAITPAPIRRPYVSRVSGRKRTPAAATPPRRAMPPSRRVRNW